MSHFDAITRGAAGLRRDRHHADAPVAVLEDAPRADLGRAVPPRGRPHRRTGRSVLQRFLYDSGRLPADVDDGIDHRHQVAAVRAQVGGSG